jgi:hypothetical protein
MAVPVATIRAQDNLRGDFDASVNYLKAFLSQTEQPDHRNVASMNRKGGKKGGTKGTNGRKSQDDKSGSKKLDRGGSWMLIQGRRLSSCARSVTSQKSLPRIRVPRRIIVIWYQPLSANPNPRNQ